MDDFIKFLRKHGMGAEEEFVVKKTIPMTKDEQKDYAELEAQGELAQTARDKHAALREVFWGKIELKYSEYGNKKINIDTKEIEVAEDDEKKKRGVKSPYIGRM